jgi:hypothetical protein
MVFHPGPGRISAPDARSWTEVVVWLGGTGKAHIDTNYGGAFVCSYSGINGKFLLGGIEEGELSDLGVMRRPSRRRIMQAFIGLLAGAGDH